MKNYKVTYREKGQMGWNKVKVGTCKANDEQDAKAVFERWAKKPSQYRRTFIKAEEIA